MLRTHTQLNQNLISRRLRGSSAARHHKKVRQTRDKCAQYAWLAWKKESFNTDWLHGIWGNNQAALKSQIIFLTCCWCLLFLLCCTTSGLSPLGMANQHSAGALDADEDRVPGGVVGRGRSSTSIVFKCRNLLRKQLLSSLGKRPQSIQVQY